MRASVQNWRRSIPSMEFDQQAKRHRFLPLPLYVCIFDSPPLHKVERGKGGEVIKHSLCIQPTLLVFLSFFFLTNPCFSQPAQEPNPTTKVVTYLVGRGTTGPYQLEDHYILEGTERIKKNGLLLSWDRDYSLDYNHGLITFSAPLPLHDTLQVNYEKVDLNLRRKYFHRELVYQGGNHQSTELSLSREEGSSGLAGGNIGRNKRWNFIPQKSSSDLTFSGSKTFSLEVGSAQDLSLKQGLWLSAKGRASQNLEIALQVSDQNMPATTEGTTKRLEELDKVQMIVTSPHFSGTLGDYYLKPSGYQLFSYEKKLKGIMAEAKAQGSSFSFAVASSNGEYFTNKFLGEDGKQGPYYLKGKNGQTNIMVLPGTERVWVDGEELERGSDNNYIIDYGRGTIQFTPRRLITSDSRIVVDFEYSAENYQRDFYSGNLFTSFLGGKAELKAGGILEKDNQSHPSSFSLSSEDQHILSQAGNDRFLASKDGAEFVREGKGDYRLVHDSSGNGYYQYAGNDSGSYKVSFNWVGEKKGSYLYRGGGIYQYVYPGNGDFLPVVFLPLAESHSLFDLNLSLLPIQAFKTQIEWAKSKRDKNTFSSKDDEHNWGDAVSIKSAYQNSDFQFLKSNFYRLELKGEYSLLKKDFAPFGRVDLVEKERTWGSPRSSASGDEETYQFSGVVAPYKSFLLDFDYGKLNTGGNFISHRRSVGAEISPANWISAKGKSEEIKSQEITAENVKKHGDWIRNLLVLNNKLNKLSTSLSWEQERKSSYAFGAMDEADRFNQLGGKINLDWSKVIKTSTELSYREDDKFEERWLAESFSYTWRNQLSARDYKGMLSSDLEFVQRSKRYQHSFGVDDKENLLTARMDFYPPNQLLNLKLYHSQNQIHSAQRVDTYMEVEEGKGDYRYEDGEYIPYPEGNFVRLSEWMGETQSSVDLNKSIRMIFSPHKVSISKNKKSLWSQVGKIFSTDSFINLRGRFVDQKAPGFYFLYPLTQLPDKSILSQNVMIRHDLYLLPNYRPLNFQFRWERSEDQDNLLSNGERHERRFKQEILVKSYLSSQCLFESRIGKEKIKNDGGGVPKNLIKGKNVKLGITRRESQVLELKLSGQYKNREDQIQKIKAEFFSVSPEFLWALLSQGRLKAEFQWMHLRSTPRGKSLPYILTEGKREGENYDWRFSFDYRLNSYLSSSVVYSGESVPAQKTKHTGRMELKAYF